MADALALIGVATNYITGGSGGLSHSSDMITYPQGLLQVADAYPKTNRAAYFSKQGYIYTDSIWFDLHGEFRAFDQLIEGDPDSITEPVMANVYITLGTSSDMSSKSELSIAFKAMTTAYGTPQDPRIRFLSEGHYDPALTGDTRFRVVLEIDQNANVNVIEQQITMGDGVLSDESPGGFSLRIPD